MRVHLEAGYVLHTRAWRDSSLLVEFFSRILFRQPDQFPLRGGHRCQQAIAIDETLDDFLKLRWGRPPGKHGGVTEQSVSDLRSRPQDSARVP